MCNKKYLKASIFGLFSLFIWTVGVVSLVEAQTITGTVFRDFNANGQREVGATFNETGAGGVTVKCIDSAGGTGTTTTSTNPATLGNYSLSGCTGATRVEFTWVGSDDYSSASGTGNNTSVQFINATRTGVDFAINYPSEYIPNDQFIVALPTLYNGDPLQTGDAQTLPALMAFNWNEVGVLTSSTNPIYKAEGRYLGSLFGHAYARTQKKMFLSASLRRHMGFGPLGAGGIYVAELPSSGTTISVSNFVNLGTFINVGSVNSRDLTGNSGLPNHDTEAFSKTGEISFGDMDISDDEKTLYLVNLKNKSLVRVFINKPAQTPTVSDVQEITIPTPPVPNPLSIPEFGGVFSFTAVNIPWAIKYYKGKVYVGVTTMQLYDPNFLLYGKTLHLTIFEYNPTTNTFNTTPVFGPLRLTDGSADLNLEGTWVGEYIAGYGHYGPLNTDIEIDSAGNLYTLITDRGALNIGTQNYPPNPADNTLLQYFEPTSKLGKWTPNGTGGWSSSPSNLNFGGISSIDGTKSYLGGMALAEPLGKIMVPTSDPITYNTDGTTKVSLVDGSTGLIGPLNGGPNNVQIDSGTGVSPSSFGKSAGLGDVEFLLPPAPIEIGNRVWLDTDNDGIQDPGETGISGVVVKLLKGATEIGSAVTDANGNYYFSSATTTSPSPASAIYGITQLVPNMAYTVHFPTTTTVSGTSYNLTTANSASGTDLIDSDAATSGDVTVLATDIPISGANNHTFDVGYSAVTCTQPTFTINAVQPTCASPTGSISIGTITGPDAYTFNYDDMGTYVTGVLGANATASSGATVASGLSAGTYTVQLFKSTDNTCISSPNQTITLNAPTGCGGGGQPDLELTKVADKTTVVSGNTITYMITLKNVGTANATGVKVKDAIPAGLTYVSSTPSQGTYTNGIWDVGTVAVGATLTLTITVTVN